MSRLPTPEEQRTALEDRVKFLEGEYERLYHTDELLAIYIPKLVEADIKYKEKCTDYYFMMQRDVSKLRDILGSMLDDLQSHYKAHNLDRKKREGYASKRKGNSKYD